MKRIMVVEDEPLIAFELESILEEGGYAVVGIARDADAAVAMAAREKPEAATMDIDLAHGSNGIDAAARLHRQFGLRCVFVSAKISPQTMTLAAPSDPLGFVSKPPWTIELLAALRKLD